MRITTLLRRLVGVIQLYVKGMIFSLDGTLGIQVHPRWRRSRCGCCGRKAPRYDRRPVRRWMHLPFGRTAVDLLYAPWRVSCPDCGVHVEQVPWASHASRFTYDFEELVAYFAQITDQSKVQRLLNISWSTVSSIVERVVSRKLDADRLSGLRRIGIDEFSYRKNHHYLTVVVDHDRRRVIWTGKGKSSEALKPFFELLGNQRCEEIETVTIDLSAAFIKAVRDNLPKAEIVFDRFHVQRLASDAVEEVRRSLVRKLARGSEEARATKRTRYILLTNYRNLNRKQRRKLANLQHSNKPLYRAFLLKESLGKVLDYRQPWRAERALEDWLAWASRSKLKPFIKAARTIRKHKNGILAYITSTLAKNAPPVLAKTGPPWTLESRIGLIPFAPSAEGIGGLNLASGGRI